MEHVNDILNRALEVPTGPLQVAALEEAVRAADVLGEVSWQFYARHQLIRAAFVGGDSVKIFPALSWCLGQSQQHSELVNWDALLWQCKHALSCITGFPSVSKTQIEELAADVLARYRRHGASLRGPLGHVMVCQLELGQLDSAAEYHQRWIEAPRDDLTEPEDWEAWFETFFHFGQGNVHRALEIATPFLNDPTRSEETFPWFSGFFMMEFLRQGEPARSAKLFRQSHRMCVRDPRMQAHLASHIGLLALTGNFERAVRLFERHLPWRECSTYPRDVLDFDNYAWCLFRRLQAAERKSLNLHLPSNFAIYRDDGIYQTNALADWFESQVHELELQFDARNGNQSMSDWVAETVALDQFAVDYPIKR